MFAPSGRALVIAGAGSGKTRALTYRVARLLAEGVAPDGILLATFTNRAAREMLRRVEELTGVDGRAMWAGTFHSVALRILREHGHRVGLGDRFAVLDRHDSKELLSRCIDEEWERRLPAPALLQTLLSHAAGSGLTLERTFSRFAPRFLDALPVILRIADRFARKKAEMRLLDFDDLLVLWKLLILDDAEARGRLEERFRHVLVDEYQDVSPLQAELMERSAAGSGNLMIVGDDAQSIYRFRGAELALLLDFPTRFPDAKIYRLETNYRSTPEIVEVANRSIARNVRQHKKTLRAVRDAGARPRLFAPSDGRAQAESVVDAVLSRVAAGRPLSDQAVLYRSHAHCVELQVELARRGVPHVVRSGPRFFEQAHIKDAVAFLRIVDNERDHLAWSRVVKLWPGIGRRAELDLLARLDGTGYRALSDEELLRAISAGARASLKKLNALVDDLAAAVESEPPSQVLRTLVERSYRALAVDKFDDATARLEDLALLAAWAERHPTTHALLADLALVASVRSEGADPAAPGGHLTLSSVHQAKGLEWPTVFVLWLCDGYFPPAVTLHGSDDEEEERRLFHVAVTRARDELLLYAPALAVAQAEVRTRQIRSRFVDELLPNGLITHDA